jgi:hypothetical protein
MSKDRFLQLCEKALDAKGFSNNTVYKRRFKWEVQEIICKEKFDYFLDLHDRKVRYAKNENNLLICWLLEIVPDFEIEKEPSSVFLGDLPDIDVDYIPMVRDYLKNDWAPKTFGAEHVCNIGNYTTFGIKSALIDMVRVFDGDRDEIMAITKTLETKDDEGKPLTWDTALNLYPELKKFTDKNPEIADATRKIINRNRGMGVHAGGLIVSSKPLHDLVPLVKRKDSPHASAWVEGLHGQDLQPVGLIKFDLLVISNLLQIARCCEMVKNRHGVEGICNKPGKADWTDVDKWRNDPKSLAMANSGDLKCIFQFDSEGMRALVRSGGVERFEDMVAYSALFRPGCLKCLRKDSKIMLIVGEKEIAQLQPGLDSIAYLDSQAVLRHTKKYFVFSSGKKKLIKIRTKSGKTIIVSPDHPILTKDKGFIEAGRLKLGEQVGIIQDVSVHTSV